MLSFKYTTEYLETFHSLASDILNQHPKIECRWTHDEKRQRRELTIPKTEEIGFDVGVNCEVYGLYPWAGDWVGPCWDIATPDTTFEAMSKEVLALIRILLSPESRIKTSLKGDRVMGLFLEFATPTGWHLFSRQSLRLLPCFGKRREIVNQNFHLPARANFNGKNDRWYEHYGWTD